MKKQYIAAVTCLVAGIVGFVGVYSTERTQEKREASRIEAEKIEDKAISETSKEIKPKENKTIVEKEPETREETATEEPAKETVAKALHFSSKISWPVKGEVILPYSMSQNVYFKTLDQYKHNSAMIISAEVSSKVYAVAAGKITSVGNSEETGCTVKQDLGDGYEVVYGQLKDVKLKEGESVEPGQVIGYVNEPTKYYSLEGPNLYLAMTEQGKSVNPMDYIQ